MADEDSVQRFTQIGDAHLRRVPTVTRMGVEKLCFVDDCLLDGDSLVDLKL